MIPRYSRPEMVRLWTPEHRYQTWLEVELAAARAMADAGLVPREAVEECARKAGTFNPQDAARIDEIEKVTRHDVIAFLTFLEERIGPAARHLHFGMTSSDVLDTSFAILLRDAADLILEGIDRARDAVVKRLSLGLSAEPVSTQIVQRDRHAEYFSALALAGASIEKFAVEIRHLQRTEVREAEEPFGKGQKGSSAMPHKRNPILSENLSGLARLLRGYAVSALEDVALWHERDISHSSVERVIGPDATVTLDFMLHRFAGLVEGLRIYPERMRENLEATRGLVFSQPVLLKLIERGMERQAAYVVVQRNAMTVWDEGKDFKTLLARDPEVKKLLSPQDLDAAFDLDHALRHVDAVFERVVGKKA